MAESEKTKYVTITIPKPDALVHNFEPASQLIRDVPRPVTTCELYFTKILELLELRSIYNLSEKGLLSLLREVPDLAGQWHAERLLVAGKPESLYPYDLFFPGTEWQDRSTERTLFPTLTDGRNRRTKPHGLILAFPDEDYPHRVLIARFKAI